MWTASWLLLWGMMPFPLYRLFEAASARQLDRIGLVIISQLVTLGLALTVSGWFVMAAFVVVALSLLLTVVDEADKADE